MKKPSLQTTLLKYNINEKLLAEGIFETLVGDNMPSHVGIGLGEKLAVVARVVIRDNVLDYQLMYTAPASDLLLQCQPFNYKIKVRSQLKPAQLFQMSPCPNEAERWNNFVSTIREFYSSRDDWYPTHIEHVHSTAPPSSCGDLDLPAVKDKQYFDAYYSSRRPFFIETVVSESSLSLPAEEHVDGCPHFTPFIDSRRPFHFGRVVSESTESLPAKLPSHGCEIVSTPANEVEKKSGTKIWRLIRSMCVCIPRKNHLPLDTSSRSSTPSTSSTPSRSSKPSGDASDVRVSKDEIYFDAYYSSRSPFMLDTVIPERRMSLPAKLPSQADNYVDSQPEENGDGTSANEVNKKSGSKIWRRIRRVFACFSRKKHNKK